jgi:hypothetical protein
MTNTELIARAICQFGHCEKCDKDCIDYRAALRVVEALELAGVEVSEDDQV